MPGLDLTPPKGMDPDVRELWRQLSGIAILKGKVVSGSVTSASSVLLDHGLGRRYVGAFLIGADGTEDVAPQRPADTDAFTGGDAATNLLVRFFPPTSTVDFNLWVF